MSARSPKCLHPHHRRLLCKTLLAEPLAPHPPHGLFGCLLAFLFKWKVGRRLPGSQLPAAAVRYVEANQVDYRNSTHCGGADNTRTTPAGPFYLGRADGSSTRVLELPRSSRGRRPSGNLL